MGWGFGGFGLGRGEGRGSGVGLVWSSKRGYWRVEVKGGGTSGVPKGVYQWLLRGRRLEGVLEGIDKPGVR